MSIHRYLGVYRSWGDPRGTLVATAKQCWECGTQYHCEEETYDDFVPEKEAEQMPMSKLIRETNTALKEWLDSRRQG